MKSELSCGFSSVTVERLPGRGSGGRRAGPAARRVARAAIGLGVLLLLVLTAWGQEEGEDEGEEGAAVKKVPPELLERAPFFQITLDAANENAVIDIMPLESVPVDPKPTDRLRIRLLDDPDQLYDVLWEHIVKLRTYEQLVFDKAQSLIAEKKYDEAFRYFDYLLKNTQVTAGLQRAVLEYLLTNGATCVDAGEFTHGLAILEELTSRDKNFRRAEVEKRLAQVCDKLIRDEVDRGDFRKARGLIERLRAQYSELNIVSLEQWRQQLIDQATALKQQSQERLAASDFREAERLSRQMMNVWPSLDGAADLALEIAQRHPMVIVGVAETAVRQDVTSIDNWPARRTGRLTERTLLEFAGAGPEGGRYLCSLGEFFQSDDRRRLTLKLNPGAATETGVTVNGYDVSRRVLSMADPRSPHYLPSWAALAASVRVEDVFATHIDLRRPHVLPEAFLQIRVEKATGSGDAAEATAPSQGPYLLAPSQDKDVHFVVNPRFPSSGKERPAEIVERFFPTPQDALAALRRGDIDIIDYLYPDDALRLAEDPEFTVTPYALPSLHVLVPSNTNMFTASQTFRRALVYGINRQGILENDILGSKKIEGCQIISGPFPIGTRGNDPLAYAYDPSIQPISYDPRLAAILKTLARRELKEIASKRGEEVPNETKLVLGYPSNQIARVACEAIVQYLGIEGIDIQCELRELPPGMSTDPAGEVDLLYVQVAMWEPVIDARRLLAPAGVANVGNEYVGMALRRLDAAKNWREARARLWELHRIAYEQVAVIPLWQTVNYLVHSQRIHGVGNGPLHLYQDVEQWRVTPRVARE